MTHDSAEDLGRLLASLERHLPEAPQLVVVDNASRDASVEVARRARAQVVPLARNIGFGAATNVGVQHARAPVIALLNPDIELLDDGLLRLAQRASREEALIVPRLTGPDGQVQQSAHPIPGRFGGLVFALLGPALPHGLLLRSQPWRSERPRAVGWAIAAALVARTDLLRTLGPFDPQAFLFYEDLDLCLRAHESGIPTLFDPQVTLRHGGGHATMRAYAGEPYELLAQRRREVVRRRLGHRRLVLDDAAQALTFGSRIVAKRALGRSPARERRQLAGLRKARRDPLR